MSPSELDDVPRAAWLTALAGLPEMGPRRFTALLDLGGPREVWPRIRAGKLLDEPALAEALGPRAVEVTERWRQAALDVHPLGVFDEHLDAGIRVLARGETGFPDVLADDVEPPHVLFYRGSLDALDGPRAAAVGTRRCSRYGFDVAYDLGRSLAASGVGVVSGLALGIDAAAHEGALDAAGAPPIAVVGSGLDLIYPPRNRVLWQRVEKEGLVLSEYPMGVGPRRWHFPARNRLIAALADVVVIVESARRGGSMYTVDEAERRGRTIVAVPGPITSPTSEGTNILLADRAVPYLGVETVLTEFALDTPARTRGTDQRPTPRTGDQAVLDAIGWEPTTLEHVALRSGLATRELVEALDRLVSGGWIDERDGWWERVGRM